MKFVKQKLKDFLSSAITVNEIFIASLLLLVNFLAFLVPNLSLRSFDDFQGVLALLVFVSTGFLLPLYITIRIIFKTDKINSNSQYILGFWGTIWTIALLPISFITLYMNVADTNFINNSLLETINSLSYTDYLVIIYLVINLLRIVFLFLFSAYLKIDRFDVTHISINKLVLVTIAIYALYVLFEDPVLSGELAVDTLFNLLQSTAMAYISASVILDFYYILISTKHSIEFKTSS